MKTLHSILSVGLAIILFASPLAAQVGTPWNRQINNPNRFRVLNDFGDAAVLDRETGLVWEQSPSTSTFNWFAAQVRCNELTTGGRFGWRLPTLQELASLVDPGNPGGNPDLPPGHPFSNIQLSFYISATTDASSGNAWIVSLSSGAVLSFNKSSLNRFAWCVRGGQGVDPQ